MIHHLFSFKHPTTILVAGPTQAGKTEFVIQLLREKSYLLTPEPDCIHWAFGQKNEKQMAAVQAIDSSITFSEGFPDLNCFDSSKNNLLILDDLMDEIGKSQECSNLFTRGSHHNNITVIGIIHNLFNQQKFMRTLSINTRYYILLKSPRDLQQIATFGRQIFPQYKNFLVSALDQATQMHDFGYLVVDLHTQTPDSLRVCTGIFHHQIPVYFIPQSQ